MAPPSKWDDEEESTPPSSPPPVAARRKFADEEDSDVVDDWEAEDSEEEREKAAKAAAAKAKADAEAQAAKKSKAQRIKEKEAERRRRMEEEEEETSSEEEDEVEQRARLRRTEQEADLKHAEDLIGDIDLNQKRAAKPRSVVLQDASDPSKAIDLASLPLFKPATKDQFARLTETLIPILTAQSKKPQYALWATEFTKQLVKEMPSQEIKKVASGITTVSNEKLKEEKAADKGGKKSKAAKTKTSLVTRGATHLDTTAYDGDELDDDDFM